MRYGSGMASAPSPGSLLAVAIVVGAFGCGSNKSSPGGGDASTGGDAETDAGDDGAGPAGYPAFPADLPQVQKNQGAVLSSPVLVTVSWPGDANASTWEGFGDAIGASTYWSATTSEYGVGPATSGPSNHVRMTQALPPSLSYTDLQNFVVAAVQAAESDAGAGATDGGAPDPAWPRPTLDAHGNAQTIYSLFIAPSTNVTDPGSGQPFCVEGGLGYHDSVVVGTANVAYSVTLECAGLTDAEIEETAAHESVEAATDPFVESATLGYVGFDADHLAWDIYTGFNDELADACQNWQDSYYEESGSFPYWVQRSWSNAAASKGADPCVPAAAGTYYGMALLAGQATTVQVDLTSIGASKESTKGFAATVGQPLTFQVGYFSDASAPAWKIAYDFPSETQLFTETGSTLGNGTATVTIDKTTGANGDVANVSVTVKTKGTAGFQIMAITWDPPTMTGFAPHYLPIVLVDQ